MSILQELLALNEAAGAKFHIEIKTAASSDRFEKVLPFKDLDDIADAVGGEKREISSLVSIVTGFIGTWSSWNKKLGGPSQWPEMDFGVKSHSKKDDILVISFRFSGANPKSGTRDAEDIKRSGEIRIMPVVD